MSDEGDVRREKLARPGGEFLQVIARSGPVPTEAMLADAYRQIITLTTKEEAPAEWRRMPEVEAIVQQIIRKYHKHLDSAQIAVLGKPKAGKHLGKRVIVTVHRPTAAMKAMLADEVGEIHYHLVIGMNAWGELDQDAKHREIDRALCYMTGLDEKGAWQLTAPDVSEFTAILTRYGAFNADLEMFVKAARQLDLPGM